MRVNPSMRCSDDLPQNANASTIALLKNWCWLSRACAAQRARAGRRAQGLHQPERKPEMPPESARGTHACVNEMRAARAQIVREAKRGVRASPTSVQCPPHFRQAPRRAKHKATRPETGEAHNRPLRPPSACASRSPVRSLTERPNRYHDAEPPTSRDPADGPKHRAGPPVIEPNESRAHPVGSARRNRPSARMRALAQHGTGTWPARTGLM